jgi:hypothetical protein
VDGSHRRVDGIFSGDDDSHRGVNGILSGDDGSHRHDDGSYRDVDGIFSGDRGAPAAGRLRDRDHRDLTEVLIVLLSIPFALVGTVWLLYALSFRLSTAVWVGVIALVVDDASR